MVALSDVVDGKLREIVAVRAGKHLLEVGETGHHGNNVVLNIAEIESDVHVRRDFVIRIAAFGEAFQHIRLATQEFHQTHDVLTDHTDLPQERMHVIVSSDEHLVFDNIGFLLDVVDNWREAIHDVVTKEVS